MKVFKNYINGKWVKSASGKTSKNYNPANKDEVICEVQASLVEDAEAAMQAAADALASWRSNPVPKRAAFLRDMLRIMQEREDDLVRCITLENGKTLQESKGEFLAALKEADYQVGQGWRLGGAHVPSEQPGVTCYLTRQPLGVVSIITPWNFPLNVACRKMIPALIAGNTCVLKPADFTPMTAALLFEIIDQAGFPAGVANFITGRGSVIGDTLTCYPAVRGISFTGSTEVGLGIAEKIARRPVKIQLELGGKNPLVVLKDADIETAADAAVIGAFSCSGQWCTSTSRVIVEEPVYEAFLEALVRKAEQIVVGSGLDKKTKMGPVAGPQQYETIQSYIASGKAEGARVCTGGYALTEGEYGKGYFI
jgi:aldehyde dehydrogenase (NAD+)